MATNNAINLKNSGIVSYDGSGVFTALANPLTVSNGGTGVSSFTAYAAIAGGTTSTGALQSLAGLGSSGQVLTSNGAGALPTFQAASGGTGYVMWWITSPFASPADSTTYYLVNGQSLSTTGHTTSSRYYLPVSGTINTVYGTVSVTGTLGSSENVTMAIRLNDTTDYNITTTAQWTAANNTFNATSLGVPIAVGDFIEFKVVCPAWSPNPTNVSISASAVIS